MSSVKKALRKRVTGLWGSVMVNSSGDYSLVLVKPRGQDGEQGYVSVYEIKKWEAELTAEVWGVSIEPWVPPKKS